MLSPGQTTNLALTPSPSNPSDSIDFVFTFGTNQYTYNHIVNSFPSIGAATTIDVSIGLGSVFNGLGISSLASLLSIDISAEVTNSLASTIQTGGFGAVPTFQWSQEGTQSNSLSFTGGASSASIGFDLQSTHQWQTQVKLNLVLGSVTLYSAPVSYAQFSAPTQNAFSWYHVSVSSQYSSTNGDAWYLSGSSATISISDTTLNTGQGSRVVFNGWQGQGSQGYSGGQQTFTISVEAPLTETAMWKAQYSVTIVPSTGGNVFPSPSTQWYDSGSQLSLQANPDPSYQFTDWQINGQMESSTPLFTYTIQAPATILAEFSPIPVTSQSSQGTGSTGMAGSQGGGDLASTALNLGLGIGVGVAVAFVGLWLYRRKGNTPMSEKKSET